MVAKAKLWNFSILLAATVGLLMRHEGTALNHGPTPGR